MVNEKAPDQQPQTWRNAEEGTGVALNGREKSAAFDSAPMSTSRRVANALSDRLSWMPPWCRYDPKAPPTFSIWHNILFAFAGAFTVGNLYYNHPILNILAHDFNVPYVTVSRIPTLMQAGYATGLLFVCPLGDLLKRRPLTLVLIFFTATMWIGLCTTRSFTAFCAISYICAITTVIPQVMLPLVAELAPAHQRALALSITTSGNLLGIVIARILSGVVTQYTSWRNVYWIALGLQYLILTALWLFMPDYPSTNPDGLNYVKMIGGIVLLYKKHAVLVQAGLISFCISAAFTSFWTTLTFLLADPPYEYSPVVIGLFALIGIAGILLGPLYAKYIIQPFAPMFGCLFGLVANLLGVVVGTYSGKHTVAGPIIQAFTLDMGLQITQVANRSAIAAIEPNGRNRVNTAFMLMTFTGQLTGTSAGAKLYERGGWVASGSLSVGLVGLTFLICLARGPYEQGWIGWSGGWDVRKKNLAEATSTSYMGVGGQEKQVPIVIPVAVAAAPAAAVAPTAETSTATSMTRKPEEEQEEEEEEEEQSPSPAHVIERSAQSEGQRKSASESRRRSDEENQT
ncbi:putative transporter YgaY [Exophiala dermatitidis]